jgi:mono/diheme cytochrome c family protein
MKRLVGCITRSPVFLSLGVVLLASGALALAETGKAKNPFDGDREAVEEGEEIFAEFCSECHTEGGMGPDLAGETWKYGGSDAQMFLSIDKGHPGMPAMGEELEEEEIWMAIAYIRSMKRR